MTATDPRAPVLIGWAQLTRFEGEPLEAWAEAVRRTGVDARRVDSLDVVYCQSWPYDDPPRRLADRIGAEPGRLHYSGIGGTTPLSLLIKAAERIGRRESDVCVIAGGEALATVRSLKKAGERPPWSHRDPEKRPFPFEAPFHPSEIAHQVYQAYTTFALRDVARRAHRGDSPAGYRDAIGRLFAPMTEVAAANPYAWFPQARTAEELTTPTVSNRYVAYPYTKLLTAIMDVDISGALVVTSCEAADRLGCPPERRVHLRGWAEARDPDYVAEHDQLWRSPGMEHALRSTLGRAAGGVDDVAHFDLYSCFPSSVAFSLDALGIAEGDGRAPFTVTGGLPYAGGPGSCYAIGSTAAMADRLIAHPGDLGLVTGVGMHLSKHAAVALSTEPGPIGPPAEDRRADDPPADGYRAGDPDARRRAIAGRGEGRAIVAAYTVHHGPDGSPTDGLVVCDLAGGVRCYAKVADADVLAAMEVEEFVGRTVTLTPGPGDVNLAAAD